MIFKDPSNLLSSDQGLVEQGCLNIVVLGNGDPVEAATNINVSGKLLF